MGCILKIRCIASRKMLGEQRLICFVYLFEKIYFEDLGGETGTFGECSTVPNGLVEPLYGPKDGSSAAKEMVINSESPLLMGMSVLRGSELAGF